MSDSKHMLLGLSDGSLYSISWKGEVAKMLFAFVIFNCLFKSTAVSHLYIWLFMLDVVLE